jgi:outer membrane protein, heavy metal efflux system
MPTVTSARMSSAKRLVAAPIASAATLSQPFRRTSNDCHGRVAMKKSWLLFLLLVGEVWVWSVLGHAQSLHAMAGAEPAAERLAGQGGETVTLSELVREAREHNPGIEASQHAADAKQALIVPARTLPDPMFGFQNMGDLIPPTLQEGDPSSARTFSLEQEVPFPGKLALKGKMAEMEAAGERWNHEEKQRAVVAEVKMAYYDYYYLTKALDTVQKDKGLLQNFAEIAQEKYRVGQGIQQDVLKAHVEISKLLERTTLLEQRRGSSVAQINGLLYRTPGTPLGKPEEVRKAAFPYSVEQLNEMAVSGFPTLKVQEREVDRNQYAVELSRKNYYPDFILGFTYFDRTVPTMYGLMFNVKVPLYFWRKQENELKSAKSSLLSARKQYENALTTLYAKIKDGYLVADTSQRLVDLYRNNVIPQAKLALESAVAGYQVGKVDFLTLVDNLVTLLEYELKYYEVLTDFQKALARLEPYVGVELTE